MKTNLSKTGYLVTDAVLAALARDYVQGAHQAAQVNDSFLRILTAHTQRELERQKVRRPTQDGSLSMLDIVYDKLYAVVLEAVTTADIAKVEGLDKAERARRAQERNRRSNFARSAKATLVAAVRSGANLMKLEVEDVTKRSLQAYVTQNKAPKSVFDRLTDAKTKFEELVIELAKDDADSAADFVMQVQAKLIELVPEAAKPIAKARTKVGELVLHPH